jgi:hypothetical protein
MARDEILAAVKLSLGVSHNKKDTLFRSSIEACLQDLRTVGIIYAGEEDPLIQLAVQMYCHSLYDPDTSRRVEFKARYDDLKGTMLGATGYSREEVYE